MTNKQGFKCVICGEWSYGWGENKQYGNNPAPLKDKGECCNKCNANLVIPTRLAGFYNRGAK